MILFTLYFGTLYLPNVRYFEKSIHLNVIFENNSLLAEHEGKLPLFHISKK